MSLELARRDLSRILNAGFSQEIEFTSVKEEDTTATIRGLCFNHNYGIDLDTGKPRATRVHHITIKESELINYPVRNAKGDVQLRNDLVKIDNVTYIIAEVIPDNTLCSITCQLTDYTV